MKRLLNIDGGGVKVYLPLLILNFIEEKTGKKILDLFDYYAGVSSGSIVLSGLLTKYSVKEIIDLLKNISKNIFYRSYYYYIISGFGLLQSKYSDYNINSEFEKYFKDFKLSDVKKPLSILSYDLVSSQPICWNSHQPKNFIKSYNKPSNTDYNLWEIVRGSTSAPTYFSPYKLDSYLLIDGSIVVNNLSESIFINALTYYGKQENFFQLSIGTGYYNPKIENASFGLLFWTGSITDIIVNASSTHEMIQLNDLAVFENLKQYYRFDFEFETNIKLDDYNAFDEMDQIFSIWLVKNIDKLNILCDELIKTFKQDKPLINTVNEDKSLSNNMNQLFETFNYQKQLLKDLLEKRRKTNNKD
jgi:patatin-like phospholipase/acyl hydrolase